MSGSGQEALRLSRSGWETLTDVREWSGGPPGCQSVIGRPTQMSGSGREALPHLWKFSGGPPDVQEALPDVWE